MAEDPSQQKKAKPMTLAQLTQLALQLDSKQAKTSFGKLPLSDEKSQPVFGFTQAKRDESDKLYLGELTKTSNIAKQSPGPVYLYQDTIKYEQKPQWGFGTADRMGKDKPKYDFYENNMFLDDPLQADISRKERCKAPKIGTEPRMQLNTVETTPGPQYLPKERLEVQKAPLYTFGFRRGGGLKNQTATPASVGPGRYVPEASSNPSTKQDFPRWTLPKSGRPAQDFRKPDKNQTYDTRSSIGVQPHSANRSAPCAHFGSAGREHTAKLGTFKDMMQGGTAVKLYHPKF
ncbi:hypothetical protein FGO68_gene16742 [Halteria grandinella]|uniref:Uncharacterized protein n=1 Tax=Halteria grandinella TaxID=5974 RepID=A0A8J8NN02_HALGN|nr:hypothetical protein FGO68_gene16742 [Halteria grandinella]